VRPPSFQALSRFHQPVRLDDCLTSYEPVETCRRSGSREPEPSIINEKATADFTRVVEQTGIPDEEPIANEKPGSKAGLFASIS
jgi:hypothetical protein